MRPSAPPLSNERGRFQGRLLELSNSSTDTGLRFLGSLLEQLVIDRPKPAANNKGSARLTIRDKSKGSVFMGYHNKVEVLPEELKLFMPYLKWAFDVLILSIFGLTVFWSIRYVIIYISWKDYCVSVSRIT